MRRMWVPILILFVVSCADITGPMGSIDPIEPTTSEVGEIYNALVDREESGTMGQIANVQYICDAINAKKGVGTVTPVTDTESQMANCEYLLKLIDKANGGSTAYGTGSYATRQIVDTIAVDDAVNRLLVLARFIMPTTPGAAIYSIDGISWSAVSPLQPLRVQSWRSIAYGNGKFVAVAYNSAIAAYSTDGINWTDTYLPDTRGWTAITYGNGKFVAIASGNYDLLGACSDDGIAWTAVNLARRAAWMYVACGNGIFVAVTATGSISHSIDGINWLASATLYGISSVGSVTYGSGVFVAISNGTAVAGNKAAYSTNGSDWTIVTLPSTAEWRYSAYGNGKFVAVAGYSDVYIRTAAYSTDGINWTAVDIPYRGGLPSLLIYGGE